MQDPVYCIDASSLMNLGRHFPSDVFPTLWEKINSLVRSGRLISPKEVLKEIEQGDDELVRWAKQHKVMFKKPASEELTAVREILAEFPSLVDSSKQTAEADPFVIALAKIGNERSKSLFPGHKYVVVTEESRIRPNRIPQVCDRYGIESMKLLEFFRSEKWKF